MTLSTAQLEQPSTKLDELRNQRNSVKNEILLKRQPERGLVPANLGQKVEKIYRSKCDRTTLF